MVRRRHKVKRKDAVRDQGEGTGEGRGTLASLWPHVRAFAIFLHVIAVVVLSLPTPYAVANRKTWQSPNMQADLEQWSKRLRFLGYRDKRELEDDLWTLAQRYLEVRKAFIAPFETYAAYVGGVRQGWRMFANPRIQSAELHIDVLEGHDWRPIYRPHSAEYDFWGDKFRHNRFRKLLGRIGLPEMRGELHYLARFVAERAARAYPQARQIRVRLYRYFTLGPAAVRRGDQPEGEYDPPLVFSAKELR